MSIFDGPKYHSAVSESAFLPPRMYPYVTVPHQTTTTSAVSNAAVAAAAAASCVPYFAASQELVKSCRYSAENGGADGSLNLQNYPLNLQNCSAASVAAAAAAAAAAAGGLPSQFYHHAAAAAGDASLNPCSQGAAGSSPDIPRYPWMSITGRTLLYGTFTFH